MLAWMLYAIMVSLLLSIGAYVAERALRLTRGRTRWLWVTAIAGSLALPTVIASVTVQLPHIMSPAVAEKVVVLREATTQALSPVMWISGSAAEPAGWRDFDALLKTMWRAASVAMLLALIAAGLHLAWRRRHWQRDTVAGAQVYVTERTGPAVVGLLRPRIVVPRWLQQASPNHQNAVIAHEQAHLDARDPQLFTFALALLVFMPWNLPLWWQLRRLRYAIEVDCDARVLQAGMDPTHYGETLICVGERQSAYVGAVAAMAESRSFLEQRLRIMLARPAKWRRLGMAALAGVSLTLTALAAQVSPPNVRASTSETAQAGDSGASNEAPGGDARPAGRVAIELPPATLDRYVGTYQLDDRTFFTVTREGDKLMVQITGQPRLQVFAERENFFFWRQVDAQIEFAGDGISARVYQWGQEIPLQRVDAGVAAQAQAELDARIASNTAAPGTETALRQFLAGTAEARIEYERMEPVLAGITRQQEQHIFAMAKQLGPVQSVRFVGVGNAGWDVYDVKFANGSLQYRVLLSGDGRMSGLMGMAVP